MKNKHTPPHLWLVIAAFLPFCFLFAQPSSRQIQLNPTLAANSEKWSAKENKKFLGFSKPSFGPFTTLAAGKLDSPIVVTRVKEGKWFEFRSGSNGSTFDIRKEETVKAKRFYHLQLKGQTDTTEAIFSVQSTSLENRQTFLGKAISKEDNDMGERVDFKLDIAGIINPEGGGDPWEFYIGNYRSDWGIEWGYIKNKSDSIYIMPERYGLSLANMKAEYFATFQFPGYVSGKYLLWIRNDQPPALQQAIATVLAIIISTRDLGYSN